MHKINFKSNKKTVINKQKFYKNENLWKDPMNKRCLQYNHVSYAM